MRTDYTDRLKYVPLSRKRRDIFLSFGLGARLTYEYFRNENWGATPVPRSNSFLQRYLVHADLRVTPHFRVFAQLGSSIEVGRIDGPRPVDEDPLEIVQGFLQTNATGHPRRDLQLRVGRQEITAGAGRMVSIREGPNVKQLHDALAVRASLGAVTLDLYGSHPVVINDGLFDNFYTETEGWFWGGQLTATWLPEFATETYYFGRWTQPPNPIGPTLTDIRHTIGSRFSGRASGFTWDLEGAVQLGSVERPPDGQTADVLGWAVSGGVLYDWSEAWGKPGVGFEFGIDSGERGDLSRSEGFFPPFPRGAYFGQIGALGPANINGLSVDAWFSPHKTFHVSAGSYFFWRTSRADGIYGVPGNPLRLAEGSRERYVGTQPQLELAWTPDQHTTVIFEYARFFAGPFLADAPPNEDIDFIMVRANYVF